MRFFKILFMLFFIFVGIGYGLYEYGTKIASDKVVEVIAAEMEDHGRLHQLKQTLEQDVEVKQYVNQPEHLPFSSKEEAMKKIIQKVGLSTIQEYQAKFQQGMTEQDIQEILENIEGKFSEEEILALKVIAYQELLNK